MSKRTYLYFYCVECYMGPGNYVKISSLLPTYERLSVDNYAEIRKIIEGEARNIVKEKYGAFPIEQAITSLTFLHENAEKDSLTLLRADVDEE